MENVTFLLLLQIYKFDGMARPAIGSMPTYDYNALLYLQNKALRSYIYIYVSYSWLNGWTKLAEFFRGTHARGFNGSVNISESFGFRSQFEPLYIIF